jgi:hypothetical protein
MTVMNCHAGRLPTAQVPLGVLPAGLPTSMLSCEYPKRYLLIAQELG